MSQATQTFQLLIGGALADSASGETFETIDPSTGEVYATVFKAGRSLRNTRKETGLLP